VPFNFSYLTIIDAIEKTALAAKNQGKHWAATCGTVEQAKRYIDMGARLVFHGCDIIFVKQGLEQVRKLATEQAGIRFGAYSSEKSCLEGR